MLTKDIETNGLMGRPARASRPMEPVAIRERSHGGGGGAKSQADVGPGQSDSTAAAHRNRPALSDAERDQRKAVRAERLRAIKAGDGDLYDRDDFEHLAKFRPHFTETFGPGREAVTLLVMIEGPHSDTHAFVDLPIVGDQGLIGRVVRDVCNYVEAHKCGRAATDQCSDLGDVVSLPAEVEGAIAEFEGCLLNRVLGRQAFALTLGVPNENSDLIEKELMKISVVSATPDAMRVAAGELLKLARRFDLGAALSKDCSG